MKKISALLIAILLSLLSITPVYASPNILESVDMQIYLKEDGSADIQETWVMDAREKTENYKVFEQMGEAYITDFSVSDENGAYKENPNWDIDASREEKANTYGMIKTKDGYELCYGLGEYGKHTYTMRYTIVNFVNQYQDAQALNWRLLDQMDFMPEKIQIHFKSDIPLNDTTSDIYAFGFEGFINFEGNEIVVTNQLIDGSYGTINYVNVVVGFDKEYFSRTSHTHSDITYQEMLEDAKKGSSYSSNEEVPIELVLLIIGGIVIIVVAIVLIGVYLYRRNRKYFFPKSIVFDNKTPLMKKTEVSPFRDIPCQKDVFLFYYIAKMANLADIQELKSGLVAALLLNWIRNGDLEFVKLEGSVFNRKKYEIDFSHEVTCQNDLEKQVLKFFVWAAGTNAILEAKEFERWCRDNYEVLDAWFAKIDIQMHQQLEDQGYCHIEESEIRFLGIRIPKKQTVYNDRFREELYHVAGFKNFLLEFSSMEEKQVQEVHIWEDYLIFASIIGLSENVEKELGRLYPQFNQQSNLHYGYTTYATHYFVYAGIHNATTARTMAEMRSSGSGGGSSFGGGGGGFSGGGGGGSR